MGVGFHCRQRSRKSMRTRLSKPPFSKLPFSQKPFLGRVRVIFAQNEGHEKVTKRNTKKAQTLFSKQMRATKKPRKSHEQATAFGLPCSGSFARGRCRQGWSEIPHFAVNCGRLPLSSRRAREMRRKTKTSEEKQKRSEEKQKQNKKTNDKEKREKKRKNGKIPPTPSTPTPFRALLNGGERNGGYATFVWQERAQTRATQMTQIPSLKPSRHRRVIRLSQRKNVPPIYRSPPFKSARPLRTSQPLLF